MRPPDATALIDLAAALDVELDRSQADRLLAYLALLGKWNRVINLTAIDEPGAMFSQHLLDSLAVVAPLRRQAPRRSLLDVGSGGGLPGVVIAVAVPEIAVTCVDASAKKATFVRQAAAEIEAPLTAVHARVESMPGTFDVVASRAFGSLADFAALTRERLALNAVWLAMKGRIPDDEIAALPRGVAAFHVERLTIPLLDAERCIVWMRPASRERALTTEPLQ